MWHWCQTVWFIAPRSDIFSASLRAEDATLAWILCKITKGITQMAPINLQKRIVHIETYMLCSNLFLYNSISHDRTSFTEPNTYQILFWQFVRLGKNKVNIYDADKLHINYGAITLLLCIWCIVKIQQLVITIRMRISGLKPY